MPRPKKDPPPDTAMEVAQDPGLIHDLLSTQVGETGVKSYRRVGHPDLTLPHLGKPRGKQTAYDQVACRRPSQWES